MSCTNHQDLFDEYLDGDLGESQSAQLLSHIEACGACQTKLEQLLVLRNALRQMPVEPARADELPDDLKGGNTCRRKSFSTI